MEKDKKKITSFEIQKNQRENTSLNKQPKQIKTSQSISKNNNYINSKNNILILLCLFIYLCFIFYILYIDNNYQDNLVINVNNNSNKIPNKRASNNELCKELRHLSENSKDSITLNNNLTKNNKNFENILMTNNISEEDLFNDMILYAKKGDRIGFINLMEK